MFETLLPLLGLATIVLLVLRFVQVVTVRDYQRGLRFSRGRLVGVVGSGTHVSIPPFRELEVVDGRPTTTVIEGQEVMTADGVAIRVSLAARHVVADAIAATTGDADYRRSLHLMLQLALRDVIATRTLDEALAARRELGPIVHQACASDLATIGIELLNVAVRDLMVPGELKRAFAGVIGARKEGEAALERARAETAALRQLANAGRMVEDNPGLLQLRIVQQLGATSGNSVVLNLAGGQPGTAEAAVATAARARKSAAPARASDEASRT
jgi:regulator of protease activity HflC (stomatin/prohibitin superfamily)